MSAPRVPSFREFLAAGLYFRCSDAIVDIVRSRTAEADSIAIPALSCNSSVADNILRCGRRIVWLDVNPETLQIAPAALADALRTCAVAVVHSYWGAPIPNLAEIAAVVQAAGRILIVDQAHRLDLAQAWREASGWRFHTFSLSKELPFALGGACIPRLRPNRLSLSPLLACRALLAWLSMSIARHNGIGARWLASINSSRAARRAQQEASAGMGPAQCRPMTVMQLMLLPVLLWRLQRARARRANWIQASGLTMRDEIEWARSWPAGIAMPDGARSEQFWPQFQGCHAGQRTGNLVRLIEQYRLCRFPV